MKTIYPSSVKGHIAIPPSKSQTLRAILFGSLGSGQTTVHRYLESPDTRAMVHACSQLGAQMTIFPTHLEIEGIAGKVDRLPTEINAGNSGIILRFVGAVAALSRQQVRMTGDASILNRRPMQPLLDGLQQLGAKTSSMDGYVIQGPIQSGHAEIEGEDSQPVSGLLIASAFVAGPVTLSVRNPGEKPWVGLTLAWFDRLGIRYSHDEFSYYEVQGQPYQGFDYTVPGDLSSAAFPVAAALVTGSELTIENMDMEDLQGDKRLFAILQEMGAHFEVNEQFHVRKSGCLIGRKIDVNDCIDTLPILAVIGCFAMGETQLVNAAIARKKESDRIHAMVTELRKMGADIQEHSDGITVRQSQLTGASLDSHHDHRVAMALTVAALGAEGASTIVGTECVAKTFPGFFERFLEIGARISW